MAKASRPRVGILALQGNVAEHRRSLERCGAEVFLVKTTSDLALVEALVIPGGESTTIGKLLDWYGLAEPIRRRVQAGMPVFGTCAGAILLSKTIVGKEQAQNLNLMDITVERNAYGRQLDSFEETLEVQLDEAVQKLSAVFIRAPKIKRLGKNVKTLARHGGDVVMARENNLLVSTFHPEMTDDTSVHHYFLSMIPRS